MIKLAIQWLGKFTPRWQTIRQQAKQLINRGWSNSRIISYFRGVGAGYRTQNMYRDLNLYRTNLEASRQFARMGYSDLIREDMIVQTDKPQRWDYMYHFEVSGFNAETLEDESRYARFGANQLLTKEDLLERVNEILRRPRELYNFEIEEISLTNVTFYNWR